MIYHTVIKVSASQNVTVSNQLGSLHAPYSTLKLALALLNLTDELKSESSDSATASGSAPLGGSAGAARDMQYSHIHLCPTRDTLNLISELGDEDKIGGSATICTPD